MCGQGRDGDRGALPRRARERAGGPGGDEGLRGARAVRARRRGRRASSNERTRGATRGRGQTRSVVQWPEGEYYSDFAALHDEAGGCVVRSRGSVVYSRVRVGGVVAPGARRAASAALRPTRTHARAIRRSSGSCRG
eukprot:2839889-Pleurochrysis_carterae.AAC.2